MSQDQNQRDYQRFKDLTYNDFRELANDPNLSPYQKIGFPDSYREGKEEAIFADILAKVPALASAQKRILDVGIGCSGLATLIIEHCIAQGHQLIACDSKEMLDLLPTHPQIEKLAGYYPNDLQGFMRENAGKIDAIITYSVFHYVFVEGNIFDFIDQSLTLLKPGGCLLIGDIPNQTKRKRFFATETGVRFHQNYTQSDTLPEPLRLELEPQKIDDGILFSILMRYRNAGFETYLLPQSTALPMSNRREDLLIVRV